MIPDQSGHGHDLVPVPVPLPGKLWSQCCVPSCKVFYERGSGFPLPDQPTEIPKGDQISHGYCRSCAFLETRKMKRETEGGYRYKPGIEHSLPPGDR